MTGIPDPSGTTAAAVVRVQGRSPPPARRLAHWTYVYISGTAGTSPAPFGAVGTSCMRPVSVITETKRIHLGPIWHAEWEIRSLFGSQHRIINSVTVPPASGRASFSMALGLRSSLPPVQAGRGSIGVIGLGTFH
jgi:hypothetical protein